jgi:hypothetical protein
MINEYGGAGGMTLAGDTEGLAENLPQCHLFHYKSHMT